MDNKALLAIIGVLYVVAFVQGDHPGHDDCNADLAKLEKLVEDPNINSTQCASARKTKQDQLKACEASDPAGYVTGTINFVKHFAKGQRCENTPGIVTDCHGVPRCYKLIINPDNTDYNCGENNKNAEQSLKCFQEQIDGGCDMIGKKLKAYNAAAAKKFCNYVEESSAVKSTLSLAVILAACLTAAM